jgi:glutamine amidotransferase
MTKQLGPITIVDYGVGNLLSVRRAFQALGCEVRMAQTPGVCLAAERLVLPGVGAFGDCMKQLDRQGLTETIRMFAESGRPLLGICVGMQMLFEYSEEFGRHEGLGMLSGRVAAIPGTHRETGEPLRVPRVGWTPLVSGPGYVDASEALIPVNLLNLDFYFIHSYAAVPLNTYDMVGACQYGGHTICAAVQSGNVMGTQFHPEKSGPVGLSFLKQFASL